jgi:hypothetical protein
MAPSSIGDEGHRAVNLKELSTGASIIRRQAMFV